MLSLSSSLSGDDIKSMENTQTCKRKNQQRIFPNDAFQLNDPPLHFSLSALLTVNHGKFPKQDDSYAFEEDSSSDSLSPEQHHSDESQGSACPSSEAVGSTPSSSSPALTSPRQVKTQNKHPSIGLRLLFCCTASGSCHSFGCSALLCWQSELHRHQQPPLFSTDRWAELN